MITDKIPPELCARPQWVVWKSIERGGQPVKVPFQPDVGKPASSTDPATWSSIDTCCAVLSSKLSTYSGLGYVFSADDPYAGIDFDGCRDKATGRIDEWALHWLNKLKSYSEVSPSETGVKVWIRGKLPFDSGKKVLLKHAASNGKPPGIEAYDHGRYFCVTGRRLANFSGGVEDRQSILDALCKEFFQEAKPDDREKSSRLDILERARRYIDRIPGAVAGQSGHNQTFSASCALILGFNLGRAEAFTLLAEWNHRCQPAWNEKELRHKIESADKQSGLRGYLIGKKEDEWDWEKLPKYQDAAIPAAGEPKPRIFTENGEGLYRLEIPDVGVSIEVDRLRRESHELIGELCVRCSLPGVKTFDGSLSIADFNLSSARARTERATMLKKRAEVEELDWAGYLEEFTQRVLASERRGQAAVDLRTIERPAPDDTLELHDLKLPRRHPCIIFGDGGAAKSYVALYFSGLLVYQGLNVAIFDWELAGEDHRDRLERIFGCIMPKILYARCERPLVYEMDRLRRIVRDEKIDYAIYDSIVFACDGPPESAESAGRYFRAVRQVGVGSLHIAHITKGENGDQKPFGSVFWHNGARSTWYAKLTDQSPAGDEINLGLFNRKSNLTRVQPAAGFKINFAGGRTYFSPTEVADIPDLADSLTIKQRMIYTLRSGSKTTEQLATELGAKVDSIEKTLKRHGNLFTVFDGGKVGLAVRQ